VNWSNDERKARQNAATATLKAGKAKILGEEYNLVEAKDIREFVAETPDVRDAILELAEQEKVSAIVVGSRGLSAVKRFILGSTSSYLVTHAPCPVIVCRLKEDS